MPKRSLTARVQSPSDSPPATSQSNSQRVRFDDPLTLLRTQWKWAAFSQFFFTFNRIFAMNDVSLTNIEEDLVHGSRIVLPRVMQRLLYTISYDRKVTLDNWQTALRKQYHKRNPSANPIGPEPRVEDHDGRESSSTPEISSPQPESQSADGEGVKEENKPDPNGVLVDEMGLRDPESTSESTLELGPRLGNKSMSIQPSEIESESMNADQSSINGIGEMLAKEDSKDWMKLPMLVKLDSLHMVTEWLFHNPTRLRTLMRSDDENASWRIEPVGYDSKKNAYWLIGADRLWIQRPVPKPPRSKNLTPNSLSLKRKGSTVVKPSIKLNGIYLSTPTPAAKRPRLHEKEGEPNGRVRAAKAQAKIKLDKQVTELAGSNWRSKALTKGKGKEVAKGVSPPKVMTRATGTRLSTRLRGKDEDDEWQAIPEEWLNEGAGDNEAIVRVNGKNGKARGKVKEETEEVGSGKLKTGLESDGSEISELTDLSEESKRVEDQDDNDTSKEQEQDGTGDALVIEGEVLRPNAVPVLKLVADGRLQRVPVLPEGFIEWETICVTLNDWDHIAERFERGTHYSEKAFHKLLVKDLVPTVTQELREIERKQRLTTAMVQRKRSSRLLLRQSEKEEAETASRKLAEEAERNSRAMRQEARAKREDEAREMREIARETRRREREEKEEREKVISGVDGTDGEQMVVDVVDDEGSIAGATVVKKNGMHSRDAATSSSNVNGKVGNKSGSRTPVGEDWELDCEICHRRGVNLDDGTPMMSCGVCSKWQHIACHDLADQQAGRRRRNWDVVEFLCLKCQANRVAAYGQPGPGVAPHGGNPYLASARQLTYAVPITGPAAVNGSGTPYYRSSTLNVRSAASPSHARAQQQQQYGQHSQSHLQQQAYGTPISFTHYQPQQRGFSSSAQEITYTSGNIQPYGQVAISNQFSQYPVVNSSGQPHPQTSLARWNITPSHQPNLTSFNASESPTAVTPSVPHAYDSVTLGSNTQTSPRWQQGQHQTLNVASHSVTQHVSQLHYYPSPYQPAPSS